MLETKTTLVADILHGVIALSPLEKRLVATRAFNRLHNVLQNSTVYFTYPSNRTSRLSHSLGVAKIAGELFRQGLLNATVDDRRAFLKMAHTSIGEFQSETAFREDTARHTSGHTHIGDLLRSKTIAIPCDFYSSMLLAGLEPDEIRTYLVLLQSVRYVALLHDLGHPPFSHVTEAALQSGFERLQGDDVIPTSRRGILKQELTEFLSGPDDAAFHELLGLELTKTLLDTVLADLKKESLTDYQLFDVLVIKHATLKILQNKPFFCILHQIVDSDLDADRLDYVQRDLISSGMSREPFRPDRLIQSFTLIADAAEQAYPFLFLPSIRALNNLEDFFHQRFQLYKYVIFHHRVVKFDGLLQRCIEEISDQALIETPLVEAASGVESAPNENPLLLPTGIAGIWSLFSRAVSTNPLQRESFYVQWDDAWLLGALRNKYFTMKRFRSLQNPPVTEKTVLEVRLEEMLSNQKHHRALFKRGECFYAVDDAFWRAIPDNTSFTSFGKSWEPNPTGHFAFEKGGKKIQDYVSQLRSASGDGEALTELVEQYGYVLSLICALVHRIAGRKVPLSFLFKAALEFKEIHFRDNILDVIVIPKTIKAGVQRNFRLAANNMEIVPIGRVSPIAGELERASLLFPPFFVYMLSANEPSDGERLKWRAEFGQLLWKHFQTWALID